MDKGSTSKEMNKKIFKGEYNDIQHNPNSLLELSVCNNFARHPKITNRPGKFIVFKMLILKHYGMDYFYEDKNYWYFKR
jgi:hypothetical protein